MNVKEHHCTIAEAADLLEIYTDAGDPVMMWGAPGIGKTSIAEQLAARKRRKMIGLQLNILDPVDIHGIPVPCEKTRTVNWYAPNDLPRVDRDGENGYLFTDEINTASQAMMNVAMRLVLEGKVADYRLPPGWIVIAAGNRIADRASVGRMSTALRNRFAHLHITPDVDAWAVWANANGVAPELVAFLRFRREFLHVMPKGDENAFPTPRSWVRCSKYVNAPAKHRMRLFAGHVGDAYAAEFDAFIGLYRSLGSLADIIANPTAANVPNEPSLRYAVCTGLARMATKDNLASITAYAKRLPRESEILVMHDATTRDTKLRNTKAYGQWAVDNQDVIIQ